MWQIVENHRVIKQLAGKTPPEVQKRYEKWKQTASVLGPEGLEAISGLHDEALRGKWKGHRASRLGLKWRVIYQVVEDVLLIQVVEVNAHDYKNR